MYRQSVVAAMALTGFAVIAITSCDQKPDIPLNAVVSHLGPVFVIKNNDPYNWGNCDLDLNSDYSLKEIDIPANTSYKAPAASFAKKDGTRFNFLATKPQTLFIYCRETPSGTRSAMVGWK
jgi:hypothetical protein